jgi:hypothetical protein
MKPFLRAGPFLILACASAVAGPPLPDTPAGKFLSSWLAVVGSSRDEDRAIWLETYESRETLESLSALHEATGGLELVGIGESTLFSIEYVARQRAGDTRLFGRFILSQQERPGVVQSVIRAMPPGWEFAGFSVGFREGRDVIREARKLIREHYVLRREGKRMMGALFRFEHWGWYSRLRDGELLANVLTQHLQAFSGDRHIRVNFNPARRTSPGDDRVAARLAYRRQLERLDCGFERAERLANGIGFLRLRFFADAGICEEAAAEAMGRLSGARAVIVDLRDNFGGDPALVRFISSYFFDEPTHLNNIWTRSTDETEEIWTIDDVPGDLLADASLFVLMSASSFSAAEEFAYSLQTLGRATVIGEVSAGGAHLVRTERLTDQFTMVIPVARAVNPITGTNWESTGVIPDVPVPAADAIPVAERMAGDAPRSNEPSKYVTANRSVLRVTRGEP